MKRADHIHPEKGRLLTPAEAGKLFRLEPAALSRLAHGGRLACVRTVGGHRRYWEADIKNAIRGDAR